MKAFIVGGAGFIGSHLADQLVARGDSVTVFDNFSVGKEAFLEGAKTSGKLTIVRGDALELDALKAAMVGHHTVFHLAANPEARWGLERTRLDLEQGTIATYNALEAARLNGVKRFIFSSSGTVYGNTQERCAEEDMKTLPISLYGASKLAGEALIAAFVECFAFHATIARFGNVVGGRATHGAIFDFYKKLKATPNQLEVLGDGTQSKPYLHVEDCARGLLYMHDHAKEPISMYNLGPADWTSVKRIAEMVVAASPNPSAKIVYGAENRGWPGDVPKSLINPERLAKLGFRVSYTSDEAVHKSVLQVATQIFHPAADAVAKQ
jgi:UDP-glucose 4-epimerase